MDLSKYDEKYVQLTDIYGETFTGIAVYDSAEYCFHEYGIEEDALRIGDCLIYKSQIASLEEIEPHGSAEIWTERLILRRYRLEDASALYEEFGKDEEMHRYSGWNPYATPEMAEETVRRFIAGYDEEHFYAWVMDFEDVLFDTIGAYDYKGDSIEVGLSVAKACWGRGYATEALQAVLHHLTENERIPCVTAWCASENIGSQRAMEKAGMKLARIEKDGLNVGDETYDKLFYEYKKG